MTEQQLRYVRKPTSTWKEPTLQERLEIIRCEIGKMAKYENLYVNEKTYETQIAILNELKEREKKLANQIQAEILQKAVEGARKLSQAKRSAQGDAKNGNECKGR
jgi:hypothetical protein